MVWTYAGLRTDTASLYFDYQMDGRGYLGILTSAHIGTTARWRFMRLDFLGIAKPIVSSTMLLLQAIYLGTATCFIIAD